MYNLQEVNKMKELKNKSREQAIKYCRFQKDRNWRNFQVCKSTLEKTLNELSTKNEDELSKRDLLYLISANCDYMRALSLYNYYKEELSALLTMKEDNNNEQAD